MQSVQRKFGKLMSRGPGDNAKVSVLLNDYEDADRVLAKVATQPSARICAVQSEGKADSLSTIQLIESTKSWQESWDSLVSSQLDIAVVYAALYDPIVGASDGHGRPALQTGEEQLHRTFALKEAYTELRTELVEGIQSIEKNIINPALDARNSIAPIRKTIKKRENKRLDLEQCQDKVHKLHRKMPRSAKDDAQLSRLEDDLATLQEVGPIFIPCSTCRLLPC